MKNIFNFKLYLEGLKKIRLVGIISGILLLVLNALPPLSELLSRNDYAENTQPSVSVIDASEFALPMLIILILTPFFFLSMFSFLNKRNESDFYHAIPYKRSCVMFSFTAAIFTWIWGIIIVSTLLTSFLWFICPTTTFSITLIPLTIGIYAAVSLYIGGFILLAMTVSGTAVSNIAVAIILMFSFRIIGSLITATLSELVPMFDISYSAGKFFSFQYWLPTAVISMFYDTSVFTNGTLWIYSAIVIIGVYALATYCYCKRKSESAGKSAPAKKLQHLYRCAFTLPFALLATMALIMGEELGFFVILVAIALVVYYLYELITVKNIKSAIRSTPYLLIVLACCVLFSVGCVATAKSVYAGDYKKEEIKSIRFYDYASILDLFQYNDNSFESLVTEDVKIPDEKAKELVANALDFTIRYEQGDIEYDFNLNYTTRYVEITLDSGKTVGRRIRFLANDFSELQSVIESSAEYKAAYITLPEKKEIQNVSASYCSDISQEELLRLWDSFVSEYNALTDDEKLFFKQNQRTYGDDIYWEDTTLYEYGIQLNISVEGTHDSKKYYSNYSIPESFTETRKLYFELMKESQDQVKDYIEEFLFANTAPGEPIETDTFGTANWSNIYASVYINDECFSLGYDWYYGDLYSENNLQGMRNLYTLLSPYLTSEATGNSYCILDFNCGGDDGYYYETAFFGIRELTADELIELRLFFNGGSIETNPNAVYKELSAFTEGMYDSYFENYTVSYYMLSFTYAGVYYQIDSDELQGNWKQKVSTAQEIVTLLLEYMTEYTSGDEKTVDFSISYANNKLDWYCDYYSTYSLEGLDQQTSDRLDELLSQFASLG